MVGRNYANMLHVPGAAGLKRTHAEVPKQAVRFAKMGTCIDIFLKDARCALIVVPQCDEAVRANYPDAADARPIPNIKTATNPFARACCLRWVGSRHWGDQQSGYE